MLNESEKSKVLFPIDEAIEGFTQFGGNCFALAVYDCCRQDQMELGLRELRKTKLEEKKGNELTNQTQLKEDKDAGSNVQSIKKEVISKCRHFNIYGTKQGGLVDGKSKLQDDLT